MPAPLDETTRAAIEQAIRAGAGTVSCRGIATEHGVAPATVSRIAKDIGLPDAFKRSQTKNATRARVNDLAARRARLAERALNVAERMLDRITESYTVIVSTKDEVFHELLEEPPANEARQFATAYGILVDKHMGLIKFDTKEAANPAAASLADRLLDALNLGPAAGPVDDGYIDPVQDAES